MLQILDLHKSFGSVKVINNFNKDFDSGYIYLLTGSNGSGKTTLLKIIRGLVKEDRGEIRIQRSSSDKLTFSYVDANNRSFLHRLSVKENLRYFMALNENDRVLEKINQCADIFKASELLGKTFSELSSGQMQLISILRGILEEPKVLLLDEALVNLDKEMLKIMSTFLENFVKKGKRIVIICSHNSNLPIQFKEVIELL